MKSIILPFKNRSKVEKSQVIFEFMPAAIEVLERPASPIGRWLGRIIAALFVIAVIWACIGSLDIVAVAQGKIIPGGRVKQIQPLQDGQVKQIYVKEGQLVQKGQPLIELDQGLTGADETRLMSELKFARLNLYRQNEIRHKLFPNEIGGGNGEWLNQLSSPELAFQNQWVEQQWFEYASQLRGVEQQLSAQQAELEMNHKNLDKFEAVLPIITQRVNSLSSLRKSSYVSENEYLELEQQRIEYQQEMRVTESRHAMLSSVIKETEQQISQLKAQFTQQNLAQIEEFQRQVSSLEQELEKAQLLNEKQILTSPVTGYVQQLAVHTIGGVVTSAQPLMLIVPQEDYLEAEVQLSNKDIGFVNIGQLAEVKIETFDFTLYGVVDGEVVDITADAIEDEQRGLVYKMRLKLKQDQLRVEGKWVRLIPGMRITAEVKTAKRRIIDFFLSPIQRATDSSLRER